MFIVNLKVKICNLDHTVVCRDKSMQSVKCMNKFGQLTTDVFEVNN